MANYYAQGLNANKLRQCYAIAPERVQQFLEAEIDFVLKKTRKSDKILDLGCGYGWVALRLIDHAAQVTGIDISKDNIQLARELDINRTVQFYEMDAGELSFENDQFDMTLCIQNGISAFKINPVKLLKEALRVTKIKGRLLFSSYSEKFWNDRLEWFQIQAASGLIGEIDYNLTHDGTIICKDGFKAITYSGDDFLRLASNFRVDAKICEVDGSSLFCEMIKI